MLKHAILTLLILGFASLEAQDWPSWRGPQRNGKTTTAQWNPDALNKESPLLWTADIGYGFGGVTAVNNQLFAFGSIDSTTDAVTSLNTEDGSLIWQFTYNCPAPNGCFKCYMGPRSTPVWDDHCLYTLSHQGQLHCLDAKTGKILWKKHLTKDYDAERPKYGFSGSPVVEDDLLILNARESGIVLHKKTGKKIWSSPGSRASYSTPVVFSYRGKKAVMIFAKQVLVCRDLLSGKEYWRHPWPYVNNDGAAEVDPVIVGEKVFISSGYRKGAAVIDFSNGKPQEFWFNQEIRTEFGTAIFHDGLLFAPHGDTRRPTSYLKCVDFKSGQVYWTEDTGHCSLIKVNEKFIILNQWGSLQVAEADKDGFTEISSVKLMDTSSRQRCWTAPTFADGKIYIRRWDGYLVCVDLKPQDVI